jgi:uncharacterized protein (TIGR01777 family)
MKILMTGSSGLVGTALSASLVRDGHNVCRLLRPERESAAAPSKGAKENVARWNAASGEIEDAAGVEAVVNLAGASIASGRWNEERKALLRSSRIETTRQLVEAVAKLNPRPRVLVSASATGYYGNCGDDLLHEDCPPGKDFLGKLCAEWEEEAKRASEFGMRVVLVRFGVILARHGGALPRMLLPFRVGVGGRLGSGKQWMSWLTLDDATGIVRFALENEAVVGPVNAVAPEPVRNADFTRILGKALHRPAIFPAPAFALRLALGEMAEALLLSSQRAVPERLKHYGYRFRHPELPQALHAVHRPI